MTTSTARPRLKLVRSETAVAVDRRHGSRAFEPVLTEHDVLLSEIEGALPAELTGTLYRNGPARWDAEGGFHASHAFDGDGMIAQFTFEGQRVRYRNRFVRTPKFLAEEHGDTRRGLGTMRPGGVVANAFRPPADRANTHAMYHAGRLWALSDDGRPWDIDPDTIATGKRRSFGGKLPALSLFSPHPRIDPQTGAMFNFGLAPQLRPSATPVCLNCYRIGSDGRFSVVNRVPLDRIYINHDFVLTERYLVFVLAPLAIDPVQGMLAVLGLRNFDNAAKFRPELASRIVLVPRDGGKPKIVECPSFAYVHFNNAYEDCGDVVIDLIRFSDWESAANQLRDFRHIGADNSPGGALTRLRVHDDRRVSFETLCAQPGEFPQHDWRRTGQRHRYSYYTSTSSEPRVLQVIKVDHETGHVRAHPFASDDIPGEPLFVPRASASAEDDGWLLCLVYHAAQHRSALHVLDARHVDAPAIAVARLPHHQFPGFHGSFTTRIAR